MKKEEILALKKNRLAILLENGKNFSPEEIEEKLLELPYIKECIVTTRKRKNNTIIVAKLYIDGDNSSIEKANKINLSSPKIWINFK